MQDASLLTYVEDLKEITKEIRRLKQDDTEASSAVAKINRRVNRLKGDAELAQREEEVCSN